jgi:hypothetical protein
MVILYAADPSGTNYSQQQLVKMDQSWVGAFKLRQYSEYLQVMGFDNSSGTYVPVAYGDGYLLPNPAPTWFDYFFWIIVIVAILAVLIFVGKWLYESS